VVENWVTTTVKPDPHIADNQYEQLKKTFWQQRRDFMFWTGFIVGMFVGANIGVVVAGLLVSARKNDTPDHLSETPMDHVVMDKVEKVPAEIPPFPEPVTYFDRYPHS
jgi:hypothetical protein